MKIYFPYQIDQMIAQGKMAEVRQAYAALRKNANRRIRNLNKHDLLIDDQKPFKGLRELSDDDVARELAEVSRFMRDPRHTVRGGKEFRAEVLESLHKKPGFKFVNEGNFKLWAKFMNKLREEYGNKLFDSGEGTDIFNDIERLDIPENIIEKHFDLFIDNVQYLKKIDKIENTKNPGRKMRLKDFKRAIEEAKK